MNKNLKTIALATVPQDKPPGAARRLAQCLAALAAGIRVEYASLGAGLSRSIRALGERPVQRRLAEDAAFLALFAVLLAVVRGESTDMFLSVILPAVAISLTLCAYAETHGEQGRMLALLFATLMLIGFFLQSALAAQREAPGHLSSFTLFALIGVVLAFGVGLPMMRVFVWQLSPRSALCLLQSAAILSYLVLVLFSRSINGAHNWITVGGVSVQLTELCRLEALLAMGITLSAEEFSDREKFRISFFVLLPHMGFLALCNELSTLVILFAVWILLVYVLTEQTRKLILTVLLCALAAGAALIPCRLAHSRLHPENAPAPPAEEVSSVERALSGVYEKLSMRVLAIRDPEAVGDFGYQQQQATRARLLSGWFGQSRSVWLPVAESDFVFSFLIAKLGLLFGIATLLFWCLMPLAALPALRRDPVSASFLLAIQVANLVSAASACGQIPVMGIGPAFLSAGGTSMVVNVSMAAYLLSACSAGRKEQFSCRRKAST